ncbi:ATP-binding protein [Streptosporangium sp. DT93]|uniref:ATP-binding protein n=1 Tax=Streptosporangium sp. DT93 TaxID=3393428 RepID=UPI003CF87F3E
MSARGRDDSNAAEAAIGHWDGFQVMGRRDLPGIARSARVARRWVLGILAGHIPAETMETLELLVSEVVTNAVLHSDSARPDGLVTVRVDLGAGLVHIEVADDGSTTTAPTIQKAGDDSLSGRGLSWVDFLSHAWGSDQDEKTGKRTVWFRLRCDGSANA